MKYLPQVIEAKYLSDFTIDTTFDDGTKKTINFFHWLNGPIFKPLKNKSYFKNFFIDGGTISWPNGADIAPETLYSADAVILTDNNKKVRTRKARRAA